MRRFFCENCGEEVDESDELCPHCGAVFAAIKCPRCGYRGKMHEFYRGCPSCGFLGEDHVRHTEPVRQSYGDDEGNSRRNGESPRRGVQRLWRSLGGSSAPWWLFGFVIAIMVLAFAVLAIVYMRL